MSTRRGLGRGLGALIPPAPSRSGQERPSPVSAVLMGGERPAEPSGPGAPDSDRTAAGSTAVDGAATDAAAAPGVAAVQGAHFAEVPVDRVTPNPRQPRQVFDEESMAELVHSIKEVGLLQPVVVRDLAATARGTEGTGTRPDDGGRYELVMGERRWRAAQLAGLPTIPAIVRETGDDAMLRDALLENLHRAQLNPLEEAAAYAQLLEDFGCTHDELAQRIGRSRPQISNTIRLLRLAASVQRRVAAGVLSAGHARALLGVDDEAVQERLAHRVVAENLSVRALEELVTLGDDQQPKASARRSAKPVAPKVEELATRLSERFDTRVRITLGRSKGRITVDFASVDDLERIVGLMDPSERW